MSAICESFNCLPSAALTQDWHLVQKILEYRAARQAVDLLNKGEEGAKMLQDNPGLVAILKEMQLGS